MKYFIFLLAISFSTSCRDKPESTIDTDKNKDSAEFQIKGAYSMTKQIGNDGTKDTLLKKEQLKIYSDRYMMYASPRATDSFGEYGIGTYRQEGNDKVTEDIFYTSSSGEVRDTAVLEISPLANGYKQVIRYADANSVLNITEEYDKAGKAPPSPLDGAWTQVRNIQINKKGDTTRNTKITQFKIYEDGYFIWANPNKDPASNNFNSLYGYGTFKMLDANKSEETNINSTFSSLLVGKPVEIEIEFMGNDKYKQTIKQSPTGGKSVEVYERLK